MNKKVLIVTLIPLVLSSFGCATIRTQGWQDNRVTICGRHINSEALWRAELSKSCDAPAKLVAGHSKERYIGDGITVHSWCRTYECSEPLFQQKEELTETTEPTQERPKTLLGRFGL